MSPSRTPGRRSSVLLLIAVLALTAAVALAWSHAKLLNQDELFVLQTDGVSSAAQVIDIQLHSPISLDPIAYHLLVHAVLQLPGKTPFALRLPSLAGFLLMQICLYLYAMRASGERAALFAAALPALTATLFYAAEARPYGLLLGLYGVALVAYQSATRTLDEAPAGGPVASRAVSTVALGAAIAITLNVHYFGILVLVPLYSAEFVRTLARRRLDGPVAAAIVGGSFAILFTLPFQRAAAMYHRHYYNLANVGPRAVTQAYRALFVDYTHASLRTQHAVALIFLLLAVSFAAALAMRRRALKLPTAEGVFLVVLAAQPFCGFLLAVLVTHTIEVRYVLGTLIGIVALAALLAAPWLDRMRSFAAAVTVLVVAICLSGLVRVRSEARKSGAILASLALPPQITSALQADPSARIYFQEAGHWELAQYYAPPLARDRITLVYSADREIRFDRHDTEALTAENLAHFSGLSIVPFDTLPGAPARDLFVLYRGGWDWTDEAFAEEDATVTPVAAWFEGEAAEVLLPRRPR